MSKNKAKSARIDPKTSKKQKVSADKNEPNDVEREDGSRVHSPHEDIECRECKGATPATVTGVSNLTEDTSNLSDQCQLRDFDDSSKGTAKNNHPNEEQTPAKTGSSESLLGSEPVEDFKASVSLSPAISTPAMESALDESEVILQTEGSTSDVEDPHLTCPMDSPASDAFTSPDQAGRTTSNSMRHDETVIEVSQDDQKGEEEDEEEDGQYDLKKIFTIEELLQKDCICCSQDTCEGLPAFGLYVSSTNTQDRWYYCLDCQEDDFDGWPPNEELPVKYLSPEHIRIIAQKCSRRKNPPMPVFEHSPETMDAIATSEPPPANLVTPIPHVPVMQSKSMGPTKAIEVHKKWLDAAQSLGGTDARIVVSKPAAKKLIFDFLVNTFQPMNITQIFMGLKAVVPQPVLNACLQEMIPDQFSSKNLFHDSDDEEDESKKDDQAKSEPYSFSLIFKPGKNLSTNLYFCDYNKIKGLDQDERNALLNELANAKSEKERMEVSLKATNELAARLAGEPTNEELQLKLEAEGLVLQELENKVADARKLKVNEAHRQNTKKRIEKMAIVWRSRRRSCLDFLTTMEENSEGQISRVKCLKGDGPIAIDSDDMVAKNALHYAKEKKAKSSKNGVLVHKPTKNQKSLSTNVRVKCGPRQGPSSDLVAVNLDAQLNIIRIYAESSVV